jgi:methionine-rich copper-binding protein CopC
MSRRLGLTLAFALAALQASAHAHLKTASPAEGATVAAPTEITLGFTEELETRLSSVTVKDAHGGVVNATPAEAVPGDRKALKVRLKPVSPGAYTVEWVATSVDTHRVTGQYRFTVRP